MWSADKNIKNDHDSKLSEAYVVGRFANCGSCLLAARDQIYKVSTVEARTENESFSVQMIEEVAIEHQRYCSEGASSKKKVALSVPAHVTFVPDSNARRAIPRRIQLRTMHFLKYGCTFECLGRQRLQNPHGNS